MSPFLERKGDTKRTSFGKYGFAVLPLIILKLFFFAHLFLFTEKKKVRKEIPYNSTSSYARLPKPRSAAASTVWTPWRLSTRSRKCFWPGSSVAA